MNKKLLSENMKKIKELQNENLALIEKLNIKDKQIQKLVKENLMLKAGIENGK